MTTGYAGVPPTPGAAVSIHGVRQEFDGGVVALDGINLDVTPGEFLAILGPSGCGKSTLLRLIAGLETPTAGRVSVAYERGPAFSPSPGTPGEGRSEGGSGNAEFGMPNAESRQDASDLLPSSAFPPAPHPNPFPEYRERGQEGRQSSKSVRYRGGKGGGGLRRADIAYVFQDAHLLPWRTVLHNVALPLELIGVPRRARLDASLKAIDRVGLSDAAGRYPNQLSGGMRMRVSLARAMVTDPKLLLLDEPFAALDEITRQHLDEQLRELWADRGMTVVFVTHSTAEATFLAGRAVVMSRRPGRVVLDRTIELPPRRQGALRATPEFARETRFLYEALERGEGDKVTR